MHAVLRNSWPLLFGIMLLMVGNGIQGTLLGIRGAIEGFGTYEMSAVMSGYFVGFLFGSRIVPQLIRSVGHVRVFAALGSLVSAVLVLYAAAPLWPVWVAMRVVAGFCFSGLYITAESWLNAATTNETRGQALSAYMIMQMLGIIGAQLLLNVGDPGGYLLFVIPSVLVSLAFTPILLTASPAPAFETTERMSFRRLFEVSPLGCVGMFLMGGVYSALFGMASVWGSRAGLSVREISTFVAAIYVGGLVFQYPLGWLSDRIDRRLLILALGAVGAAAMGLVALGDPGYPVLVLSAFVAGGIANPLYAILIAHTNDFLDSRGMAAASAGLLFINGLGAITGPALTGWLMERVGDMGFFLYLAALNAGIAGYALWRTTRRAAAQTQGVHAVLCPGGTPLAVEAALGAAQETEAG